jgi:hemoglobin
MAEPNEVVARPGSREIYKRRPTSVYDIVGGSEFFERMVARFYEAVETDPVLRPLYPDDLGPSRDHLALFLVQYWGGPQDYLAQRGAPALRMRHAHFTVGEAERDAWMRHMTEAVAATVGELDVPADVASQIETALLDYFGKAATFLRNA